MKKLQLFAYFLLISFITLSCKEDKPEEALPTPTIKTCKIKSASLDNGTNGIYEYTNGRLTKIRGEGTSGYSTFEYNTDGKLIKYSWFNASNVITGYRTYIHVSANLVTFKQADVFSNGTIDEYITQGRLEYDNNGNLTKFQYKPTEYYRNEFDANGNPTKTYYKFSTDPEYLRIEYTSFDTKTNIFKVDPVLRISQADNNNYPVLGKNNLLQKKNYNSNGTLSGTTNITYEYNEQGYSTKITEGIYVQIYQYDCQ